jgi:hypothetical protein
MDYNNRSREAATAVEKKRKISTIKERAERLMKILLINVMAQR